MVVVSAILVILCITNFIRAERISEGFRTTFADPDASKLRTLVRPILWSVWTPGRIRLFAVAGIVLFGSALVVNLR